MIDVVIGHELVVTFARDGDVVDRFYVSDGKLAWRLALIMIATHGEELQAGDVLSVEQRRRPNLIEAGLG
jgi:hypothetical protein